MMVVVELFRHQSVAKCVHDRIDIIEARIPLAGQGMLNALPRQAGLLGNIADAFHLGYDA